MRALILTPTALPAVTGNAVTAERWRRGLAAQGHDAAVVAAAAITPEAFAAAVRRLGPDVLHAHHAYRSGYLALGAPPGLPLVVSPAGTDLYVDLEDPERAPTVRAVFARAAAVVCQGEETARLVEERVPEARGRVVRVPKAFAWLGSEPFDPRAAAGCRTDDVLFFVPAGVRPVKGNLESLLALEGVWRARPRLKALFAGPTLDEEYARRFGAEVARLGRFATWVPAIPPAAMRSAYEGADVVLNASRVEGLSNALLEASAAGRAVLASGVPGNRGPVRGDGSRPPGGLLYDPADPRDLAAKALLLLDDPDLRAELGRGGLARAASLPTSEEEAAALAAVYARIHHQRSGRSAGEPCLRCRAPAPREAKALRNR